MLKNAFSTNIFAIQIQLLEIENPKPQKSTPHNEQVPVCR
jgi:hypothetical protein